MIDTRDRDERDRANLSTLDSIAVLIAALVFAAFIKNPEEGLYVLRKAAEKLDKRIKIR